MSDRLSDLLHGASHLTTKKDEDPDTKVINALKRALDSTTPERPGCPWDSKDELRKEKPGIWIPGD